VKELPTLGGVTIGSSHGAELLNIQRNQTKSLDKINPDSKEGIEKAASQFEALLLHQVMKSMWESANTFGDEGLLNENNSQSQMFRDMFNQEIADQISSGKGVGMKQFLVRELSKRLKASKE
jgi:Rod binding domain-containing protein